MILSNRRITKELIRLHRCTGWSAPLLFSTHWKQFSGAEAHRMLSVDKVHNSSGPTFCLGSETLGFLTLWWYSWMNFLKKLILKIANDNRDTQLLSRQRGKFLLTCWNHFQSKIVNIFWPINLSICLVLKRTVSISMRRFFEFPQHMFWLRNKKIIFLLHTLN